MSPSSSEPRPSTRNRQGGQLGQAERNGLADHPEAAPSRDDADPRGSRLRRRGAQRGSSAHRPCGGSPCVDGGLRQCLGEGQHVGDGLRPVGRLAHPQGEVVGRDGAGVSVVGLAVIVAAGVPAPGRRGSGSTQPMVSVTSVGGTPGTASEAGSGTTRVTATDWIRLRRRWASVVVEALGTNLPLQPESVVAAGRPGG